MLSRIPRVGYASRLLTRRYATKPSKKTTKISTVTSPSSFWAQTFKKVTAYPFTVKPRDAQVLMETLQLICNHMLLLVVYNLGPRKLLQQLLAPYVRYKTRNDPISVKAVYVPVWRVFTFVQFRTVTENGKVTDYSSSPLEDVYMPGTHTPDHLSRTPFWEFPDIESLESKPIGECIKPFEMDAQCLPFTISPFAPFDLANAAPDKPIMLQSPIGTQQRMMIFPNSITPELYAAFPVMVPVYTGEYTVVKSGERGPAKLVCEAFGTQPRIANLARDISEEDDPEGDIKVIWARTLSNHVKKLAKMPALKNDDDPCIRPLKKEELDPLLRLSKVRQGMRDFFSTDITNWPRNRLKEYEDELTARQQRYLLYFPSWWWESKLCPEHMKEALADAEGKASKSSKPKRPAKSRSRPI